jgi:hypothetical protein
MANPLLRVYFPVGHGGLRASVSRSERLEGELLAVYHDKAKSPRQFSKIIAGSKHSLATGMPYSPSDEPPWIICADLPPLVMWDARKPRASKREY